MKPSMPHTVPSIGFARAASLVSALLCGCFTAGLTACASGEHADGGAITGGTTGGCGCSAACCSQASTASSTENGGGIFCGNGEYCYGAWFCSFAVAGGCTEADPCNGQSGSYVACAGAGSTGGGSGGSTGANGGTGAIGPAGGQVPSLVFGIVGDSRPADEDPSNLATAYPTEVISFIYQDLEASSPRPQFVVATGDYAYCSTTCTAQTALYMGAAASFSGQLFPTMGNHECNGSTSSNCGTDNATGITPNYTNFLTNVLGGAGITPSLYPSLANQAAYYSVNISSSAGVSPAWTAKFVMIAANAWDATEQSWLTGVMQQSTTYTFVVRHESVTDEEILSDCPGDCGASDATINMYPYTALLVGHTHEYLQSQTASGQLELVVGNGGAPLQATNFDFGYVICSQLTDGNISCQPYDSGVYGTPVGSPVVVNAAGALQ
jgi:hypothetical protein